MSNKLPKAPKVPHSYDPPAHVVFNGATENTARYEDVYYLHHPGAISGVEAEGSQTFRLLTAGDAHFSLSFWSDEVVRIRFSVGEHGPDFSYARDERAHPGAAMVTPSSSEKAFVFTSLSLIVSVAREDGKLTITDRKTGTILHQYAAPFTGRSTLLKGLDQVRVQFQTNKKEAFFGLGDKAWDTDLQGSEWENWASDAFGYWKGRKALYRSIPFFYGLRKGQAYGIFLDNPYRSFFDFNSNHDNKATMWAAGGEMDYFFINGPSLDDVAVRYHELTGITELPPLWAMGFHQCRWSYYPESRVRELAADFREKKIPCDALYLDIDYMDGYRCFTWNKEHFPDPAKMISDLRDDGFHTVVMIDPGIRVDPDYHVYADGMEGDMFCRRPDGTHMIGPVWPPECVWPDYTDPEVRDWWGDLYKELYLEQGVSGFWNDMNEPAVFKVNALTFPEDVRHHYEGYGADHKKAHNIYGMQMTRATWDGLRRLKPEKRPFLLGRASFAGGQRYAALWTGDNVASWEHLAIANRQCLRLAISGYSLVGTDIGGFVDDPTPEMLTRWLQLAVFHPVMRVHSMGNNEDGAAEVEAEAVKEAEKLNRQDQEPWVHGKKHTKLNRSAIKMRYRLLPYLYTVMKRHVEVGTPVLRNMFFYDQKDPYCRKFPDQFLCGDDLLVCPVVKPGAKSMQLYLPKGTWYDYWTGKSYAGKTRKRVKLRPDRLPVFVRAGAVLPTVAAVQSTAELNGLKQINLSITCAKQGHGRLYWDALEGYEYQEDGFSDRRFNFTMKGKKLVLHQEITGSFKPSFKTARLRFVGLPFTPKTLTINGQTQKAKVKKGKRGTVIEVPFNFGKLQLS
jgi:alpha-glucosidase